jgi:uncharacterized iron-regulated membrane protein
MLTLARVSADAPDRVDVRELPAYLKAVLLSQPLHFADYGGRPLRVVWALFTLATVALAATGVQTYGRRRRPRTPAAP